MHSLALKRPGVLVALLLLCSALAPPAEAGSRHRPDLVVESLSNPPTLAVPGARFVVAEVTANVGRERANASWTTYALTARQRWIALDGRRVPALKRGTRSDWHTTIVIPAGTRDGVYALIACADGRHEVRETRERNNCRLAKMHVTVDTSPPSAPTLDEHPDAQANRTSTRFRFSHPEPGVSFACRLDSGAEAECTSPHELSGLAEVSHHFEVRAIDAAGNRGPSASFEWVVDITAPQPPAIDERPSTVTAANSAHFAFHGTEPGLTFACALDEDEPSRCVSPLDYTVADGEHAFTVLAHDAAGNASDPAQLSWTVVPDQTRLGDGAWCWFADPRAVRYTGRRSQTYVGWVAQNGDIKVAAYDHYSLVRTTALIAPQVQVDDHANPALQILGDGRLRVYWSRHGGGDMWYRTSLEPEDVTAWGPPQSVDTNTDGTHGYTYANPVHVSAENATYLFWRGGNLNPTFAVQHDGEEGWSQARPLIFLEGQRPYLKVASNDTDKIAFAYTDAHPDEYDDVNIHYVEYRAASDGQEAGMYGADGRRIGSLGQPIAPGDGDMVYDTSYKSWVHDVALDADGRPVIVFAAFPSKDDHRYMYARWTGERWDVHEIVAAGGSIEERGTQPYYSGGITLNHASPNIVYLSRQVAGVFEVETWRTSDGGATWTSSAVTAGSTEKNVRPVSPRGLPAPFTGDLSVIWMKGTYPSYVTYRTSITTILATGGNHPPVADATFTPTSGPGPLTVAADAGDAADDDGSIVGYRWDFGDGTAGEGIKSTHTYHQPGTYFPRLTVTDDAGAADVFVGEVKVGAWAAPDAEAGPAWSTEEGSGTLTGVVNGHNQQTTYRFEYGLDDFGSRTPDEPLSVLDHEAHIVRAVVDGLTPGASYQYRLVATNETATTVSAPRTFTASPAATSPYRSTIMTTPGLAGYWRLGEPSGTTSSDETGAHPGTYSAPGVTLGTPGALADDPDTSAAFDGAGGEMTATTPPLSTEGTLEGWFDWRGGIALMRDNTLSGGWILAYDTSGKLATRIAGTSFTTDRSVASVQDGWHYFVLVRRGAVVRLYLDGQALALTPTGSGEVGSTPTTGAWHIMRNGRYTAQFTSGRADEVAVYASALTAADVQRHFEAGR